MPRFLVLGDVHDQNQPLKSTLDAVKGLGPFTGILCVGDLSSSLRRRWGRAPAEYDRYEVGEFFGQVQAVIQMVNEAFPDVPFRFVPGNHDLQDGYWQKGIGIEENIDGKIDDVGGVRIYGFGGSLGTFGWPYEDVNENKLDDRLQKSFAHTPPLSGSIILAHSPPHRYGDQTRAGHLAGSRALADWISNDWSGIYLCGHIHEAAGIYGLSRRDENGLEIVRGLVVNCGAFGEPHPACYAVVLDYEPSVGSVAVNFYHRAGFAGGLGAILGRSPLSEHQPLYPIPSLSPID